MYQDIRQRDLATAFIWMQTEIRNILLISFKDKRAAGKTAALNAINWYTGRGARGYEGWNILGKTG